MDLDIYQQIKQHINEHERFLITSHVNPDGDAISSALVLYNLLTDLNKSCAVVIDDRIPDKFDTLHRVDKILQVSQLSADFIPEVVFVVDASSLNRIGNVRGCIPDAGIVINIDHHASNELFGRVNLIDSSRSSTVELAYCLYSQFTTEISTEIATLVYTGVICDTGRFLFPNTNAEALSLCSRMVEKGASPSDIAADLYHRNSHNTVHALADALATLEFYFEGKVACIYLANEHLLPGNNVDTEGFVDHLLSIDGTEVQLFLVEKIPDEYRISIRSRRYIDVNQVAQQFGGGGHKRAAGCTINGEREEIKNRILASIQEQL